MWGRRGVAGAGPPDAARPPRRRIQKPSTNGVGAGAYRTVHDLKGIGGLRRAPEHPICIAVGVANRNVAVGHVAINAHLPVVADQQASVDVRPDPYSSEPWRVRPAGIGRAYDNVALIVVNGDA